LQGNVNIEIVVGPDGKVQDARVISSASSLLDQAALEAVKQWEYEPKIKDDVRVPMTGRVTVAFVLTPRNLQEPSTAVRVGGNIKAPTRTKYVKPVYPPAALDARVQGVVILEVTIAADGRVRDARILRSIPTLDQAALEAVRQWEYSPTIVDDVAVPVIMGVNVQFSLAPPTPTQQERQAQPQKQLDAARVAQLQKQQEADRLRRLEQQKAAAQFFQSVMGTWARDEDIKTSESRTSTREVLNIGNDCSGKLTRTVITYERGFAGWKEVDKQASQFSIRCDATGRVSGDLNTQLSVRGEALQLGTSTFTRGR